MYDFVGGKAVKRRIKKESFFNQMKKLRNYCLVCAMDEEKKDNEYLFETQMETLRIFLARGVISEEQFEFEKKVLDEKIDRNREKAKKE